MANHLAHTRYVVQQRDGRFVGTKRFSYSRGTEAVATSFQHARLFTRLQDANTAACLEGDVVVTVEVSIGLSLGGPTA